MATIVELGGVRPTIGADVWLAPTAVLIGDVHVGAGVGPAVDGDGGERVPALYLRTSAVVE